MAAYLLLLAEGETTVSAVKGKGLEKRRDRKNEAREKSLEKALERGRGKDQRPVEASRFLSEEESVRLFVSIGRNRKVFPREILALINANTEVSKDDIGIIRILDNYSFIQVRSAVADVVIQALNGRNFRGRTLTVNYARSRRDGDEDGPQGDSPPAETGTATED
jgi:hypothetical protein